MNERDIFVSALQKDASLRPAYLDEACAGNASLRRRIDALLKAHDEPDGFLDSPADVDAAAVDTLGQEHPSTLGLDAAIADTAAASTLEAKLEAFLTNDMPAGATPAPASRLAADGPGARIGPYKLLQKIGEGGMGTVYLAEQEKPVRRRVALKVIKPGMDTEQVVARFDAERQALAIMDHNNIAKVFDAGATESGRPFFVMELVNGIPITDYCDGAKLSPRERLDLFIPVCQAIQHAHQKGIIHRDIKPSNILVTLHDGKPVPKVIDFGIAKAISQRLTERTMFTQFGAVVGTLEYMSPEQAEMSGMDIDTRTDVYALGVVLYELLAGTTPLQRTSLREAAFAEILRRIREEDPPKPSKRLSESGENLASISAHRKTEPLRLTKLVRGELDWIVMKALEKDRGLRYATANGFAQDIQRYLEGDPVEACPPSAPYKLRKFARKHRAALATVGAFALLLVAGAGVSAGLAVRADRERARAVKAENSAKDQQVRAQEREQMAIDAVRRYGDVVRETPELRNDPGLAKLRATLLKEPQAFFKRLRDRLQADRDTAPESLAQLASAIFDLALLTNEIGDREDALRSYQEALAIRDRLARAKPLDTALERDLARTHNNIGGVQSETSRPVEAMASYEAARAIWERLVRQNPSVIEYRERLAWCYHNIGILQSDTGQRAEAMTSYERARAIRERLVRENPSVTEFQCDLAKNHNDIGTLQHVTGRRAEALASYEQTRVIWERLERENRLATAFQGGLAWSYHNIGILQNETGRQAEAMASFEKALAIRERMASENPSVTAFQRDLARSHNDLGGVQYATGRRAEAQVSVDRARAIWERLSTENPSVRDFQAGLAWCHHNTGVMRGENGRPTEALASYEQASAIWERLARENSQSLMFASNLGGTLGKMAGIDLAERRWSDARAKLTRAIDWQRKAMAANPNDPDFRRSLAVNLAKLIDASEGLGRGVEAAEARRDLAELAASDPAKVGLDQRLAAVLKGQTPNDDAERLTLASRAYETSLHSAAARLFAEALANNPKLGDDRQAQHYYNAACAAALAASGQAKDDPSPDDAARAKLRRQAREWLHAERAAWSRVLDTGPAGIKATIAPILKHWQADADLAEIRDDKRLAKLPDDERAALKALWTDVDELLTRASR
jgi:eukaryotic-like serine/threonine-protein kinase